MANASDEKSLACNMLDEPGAEAGTISPENARGAAFVGQSGGFTQSLGSSSLARRCRPGRSTPSPFRPLGLLVRLVRNRPLATHECGWCPRVPPRADLQIGSGWGSAMGAKPEASDFEDGLPL